MVARAQVRHAFAHRLDHAGRFMAQPRGRGQRILARALVDVDVVETDGRLAQLRFAGPGFQSFTDSYTSVASVRSSSALPTALNTVIS